MPTGMHPWMDPAREFALWPHELQRRSTRPSTASSIAAATAGRTCRACTSTCRSRTTTSSARLHAAIRALLPILPALAASSPFVDGRATGLLDTRLEVYRDNARARPVGDRRA